MQVVNNFKNVHTKKGKGKKLEKQCKDSNNNNKQINRDNNSGSCKCNFTTITEDVITIVLKVELFELNWKSC